MPNEVYETSDIGLSAYLLIEGCRLIGTRLTAERRGVFRFEDCKDRPAKVLEFINRNGAVEPTAYLDRIKSLKAMMCR